MKAKEIFSRIKNVRFVGLGHYKVTVLYRGKLVSGICTDMQTIDRWNNDNIAYRSKDETGMTMRQAALSLIHSAVYNSNTQKK
jgi:proteasome assembly chaperone (PAC2) family protein